MLRTSCPQLKLHNSLDDLWDQPTLLTPLKFAPSDVAGDLTDESVIAHPNVFAARFDAWLDQVSPPDRRRWPVRVELAESRYSWPAASDPLDLALELSAAIRSRTDIRQLAASATYRLSDLAALTGQPRTTLVGVDLRTTHAVPEALPTLQDQMRDYIAYATQQRLPVVFASGAAEDHHLAEFSKAATDANITVVTLPDLLSDDERSRLRDSFSWDQRLMADYEFLRRPARFAGFGQSGFAWDLAVRRHFAFNDSATALPPAPDGFSGPFQDLVSALFGSRQREVAMRTSIWP